MEMRLLLALLLTVPILFLGPYFFGPQTPQPEKKSTAQPSQAASSNPAAQTSAKAPPPEAAAAGDASTARSGTGTQQQALPSIRHRHRSLPHRLQQPGRRRAELAAQGEVSRQRRQAAGSGQFQPPAGRCHSRSICPATKTSEQRLNWSYYTQTADPDGLGVTYQFSDGHVAIKKTFRFQKNSYLSQSLHRNHRRWPAAAAHGLNGAAASAISPSPIPSPTQHAVYYDLVTEQVGRSRARPPAAQGTVQAAGTLFVRRHYGHLFRGGLPARERKTRCARPSSPTTRRRRRLETRWPFPQASPCPMATSTSSAFSWDPKDFDLLKRIDPKLEQLVDFGWMSVLAKPLFLIVNWVNDNIVHNFGWAIILVTIVDQLRAVPAANSRSMKSMRKMQALKPQIDAINAKYKGISVRDPKKAGANPGDDGSLQEARRQSHGRLPAHGAAASHFDRVLQGVHGFGGNARRDAGCGFTIFRSPRPRRSSLLPIILIATQFLTAEDDAAARRRPSAAEDDDVHAADFRLHVL